MKNKKRILLADVEDLFRQALKEALESREDLIVIGETDSGQELLRQIREKQPDLVLMDVVLNEMDGFEVLDALCEVECILRPRIMILSGFIRNNLSQLASEKGVDYCIVKPCRVSAVCERVSQLLNVGWGKPEPAGRKNLEMVVTTMIHDLGMPAHVKGHQYIREAILMAVEDMSVLGAVTKVLYPAVAKRFGTTPGRVERAIRHAIEIAWDRGDLDVLQEFFGYTVSCTKGRPTNSEFIAMIADRLQLQRRQG